MKFPRAFWLAALNLAVNACAGTAPAPTSAAPPPPAAPLKAPPATAPASNVFLQPSPLLDGFPQFDKITDSSFRPAFEAGMAEQRTEADAIAKNPEPASFQNTIVALERSGRMLYRVSTAFFNLQSCNTNPELDAIATEMAPKLAQHDDAIHLDAALFARVKAVHDTASALHLDPESAQLLNRTYLAFIHAGANASEAGKARLRELNGLISSLTTKFHQNVLKATKEGAVLIADIKQLDGLSNEQIGAAASAARARGLEGQWLIPLQNTTTQPALAQLTNRAVRERIYRASIARANGGDADNTGVVAELVKLRAEHAQILGYANYAAEILEDETAGNPGAVNAMLGQLAPPALANAKKEAADIQALIDKQAKEQHSPAFKLEAWDWAFYAEQVRKARYAYDEAQTKPYFELNQVLQDGVFFAANQLYGLTFKELHGLPVYQPDVRVFQAFDADGTALGLFMTDYYARDNKQGGAWDSQYVDQSRLFGTRPVIANHLNIPKPAPGEPTLLTFDEVVTLFHEFGHAMHGMLSNTLYQSLSGANTPRDFVEYPSQYNEMWATEPVVLANYAKHYQTHEPMPKALLNRVLASTKFNQGFLTSEYIAAAILDQSFHQLSVEGAQAVPSSPSGVMAFETAALERAGVAFPPVPPRYHTPYFSHIFSNGYAAGYYAYLWSDVLARDTESWMHAHGGLKRENGDLLRAKVLSRGRTQEPLVLFETFYGRPPDIQPLLEKRGLTLQAPKPSLRP
jgi:peptidyl-dipeptidase Dcp